MMYRKPLPPLRQLKKLAEWEGPFPIKCYRVIIGADRYGFDEGIIDFLQLFPHDEVFQSRSDFLRQCENLEELIRSEQEPSPEPRHRSSPDGKQAWLHP